MALSADPSTAAGTTVSAGADAPPVRLATYAHVEVYESTINDVPLMRRCDDNWVNATQILKIAGLGKNQRTRILEREVHHAIHKKIQGGHGKFQGTWVPLQFAQELALRHNIDKDQLRVLYFDPLTDPVHPSQQTASSYERKVKTTGTAITHQHLPIQKKKRPLKLTLTGNADDGNGDVNGNGKSNGHDMQPQKLSSPEKKKKTDALSQKHMLPPTFGMFNESSGPHSKFHSKSKSATNVTHNIHNVTEPPQSAPAIANGNNPMFSNANSNSAYYNQQHAAVPPPTHSQTYSHSHSRSQSHQLEAQRELKYLQLQQQQQQQQQQHHQQQQQQQQQYHPHQHPYPHQSQHQHQHHPAYPAHHNESIVSAETTSMQFGNESIQSPNVSYMPYDNTQNNPNTSFVKGKAYVLPRYQQYMNANANATANGNGQSPKYHVATPSPSFHSQQHPNSQSQPGSAHHQHSKSYHQAQSQHQIPPRVLTPQSRNVDVFHTPSQLYKHTRHHSSPHLNVPHQQQHQHQHQQQQQQQLHQQQPSHPNAHVPHGQQQQQVDTPSLQFNELMDNQEYYTVELLSFFINDSPIPQFLFNPPDDFDVNKPIDEEGHTPLHWASALAAVDVIKILINLNADTLILNNNGMNALSKLIHFSNSFDWKNFHIILPMLKNCLVVPDARQRTPIHYLTELSVVENKINSSSYYINNIMNFIKLQQKQAEKANHENNRQLLQVIINHPDINGETALHIALRLKSIHFVRLLLQNGADIDSVDVHNIPPEILKELEMDNMYDNLALNNYMSMSADTISQENATANGKANTNATVNAAANPIIDDNSENYNRHSTMNANPNANANSNANDTEHENVNVSVNMGLGVSMPMGASMNMNMSTVSTLPEQVDDASGASEAGRRGRLPAPKVTTNAFQRDSPVGDITNANDEKNPFLVNRYDTIDDDRGKDTPHTITEQGTPYSQIDNDDINGVDNKENVFDETVKRELNNSKVMNSGITSTPSRGDTRTTNKDISMLDAQNSMTESSSLPKEAEVKFNKSELLTVKPSKVSINQVVDFVNQFPQLISHVLTGLENKNDQLNHNIETINKVDHEIDALTNKNAKLLKKISKCTTNTCSNANFTKIASSDPKLIEDFTHANLSKLEGKLANDSRKLYDLYERSQALEVAKLVNTEENTIVEEPSQTNSNKLMLAIQLTLLQLTRRKIIEETLQLYIDEDLNTDDFCFDENAVVDTTISNEDVDELRMMKSKLSVYKKLIANICGLPSSEINTGLLNEIEKVLS